MKILTFTLIFLLSVIGCVSDKQLDSVPNFELPDLEGKLHSLDEYRGKVVLLNFWATWCPPCVAEMQDLQKVHQSLQSKGLVVVGISLDKNPEKLRNFIEKEKLTFPIFRDALGGTVSRFDVKGFPETFFIGRDGTFLQFSDPGTGKTGFKVISDRPWGEERYIKAIEELLK